MNRHKSYRKKSIVIEHSEVELARTIKFSTEFTGLRRSRPFSPRQPPPLKIYEKIHLRVEQ